VNTPRRAISIHTKETSIGSVRFC